MAGKQVSSVFKQYQQNRAQFAQSIADLSSRPEVIDQLLEENVILLLRNLLTDMSPSVQQNAATAIGKLAGHSPLVAEMLIKNDVIRILLFFNMENKGNRYMKKTALMAIKSIVKHSAALAKSVIDIGGLDEIVASLEEFDPGVKEGAAYVLGYMARHDLSLACQIISAGAVPLLALALQEPDISVRVVAASALTDIAKHAKETAQSLVDAGAVPHLVRAASNLDSRLKRQALGALASIAKHSMDMAEIIIEAEIYPLVLENAGHPDEFVRKSACSLLKELVKQSPEMSQLAVEAGGLGVIVNAIIRNKGDARLPAILTLGFIAGHSSALSLSVIYSKGVDALAIALDEEKTHVGAAAAWALGHILRHSTEHAKHVTSCGLLPKILQIYTAKTSTEEMKEKAKQALKMLLLRTDDLESVEPLLHDAPPTILKYVVAQYSKVLPRDPAARRAFVTSGGLRKIQELLLDNEISPALREHVQLINACFPPDIINYFSPNYPNTLLQRVEQFTPVLNIDPSLWTDRLFSDTQVPDDVKDEIERLTRGGDVQAQSKEDILKLTKSLSRKSRNEMEVLRSNERIKEELISSDNTTPHKRHSVENNAKRFSKGGENVVADNANSRNSSRKPSKEHSKAEVIAEHKKHSKGEDIIMMDNNAPRHSKGEELSNVVDNTKRMSKVGDVPQSSDNNASNPNSRRESENPNSRRVSKEGHNVDVGIKRLSKVADQIKEEALELNKRASKSGDHIPKRLSTEVVI